MWVLPNKKKLINERKKYKSNPTIYFNNLSIYQLIKLKIWHKTVKKKKKTAKKCLKKKCC